MFLRLLGLPIGCPLELVLLDWTQSNYSQSRAVLEQAYENFVGHQKMIVQKYYDPLFQWKLAAWKKSGLISPNAKIEHSWIMPTFPWLDLLKEVKAWSEKVERGFATHSQVCKSLKTDREEVIEKRDAEVRDAIARAESIKADTGVEVPWQIFAGLKAPSKAAASKTEDPEDPEEPEEDQEAKK
jgi:capsid protein